MRAAWLLVLVCAISVALASTEMAFVPDVPALELKLGTFERFVRAKTPDSVKQYLDSSPGVFDTSSQAWQRAIVCAKNLADNAAMNVFGAVAHAKSASHFAKQRSDLAKFQYFSSRPASLEKKSPVIADVEAKASKKHETAALGRLAECVRVQQAIVGDTIAAAARQQASSPFLLPNQVISADAGKEAERVISAGIASLGALCRGVVSQAVRDAAAQGRAFAVADAPAVAFLTPAASAGLGTHFCGAALACMHGGRCLAEGLCACQPQWTGRRCTVPAAACAVYGIQCTNGAPCQTVGATGDWTCRCPPGFEGLYCERAVTNAPAPPASLAVTSSNGVTTVSTSGSYPPPPATASAPAPPPAPTPTPAPAPAPVAAPAAPKENAKLRKLRKRLSILERIKRRLRGKKNQQGKQQQQPLAPAAPAPGFVEVESETVVPQQQQEQQQQQHGAELQEIGGRVFAEAEAIDSKTHAIPDVVVKTPAAAPAAEQAFAEPEYA